MTSNSGTAHKRWREQLAIPAVAAPMFLVSGPDLVVETCRSGILGTFPALNQRTSDGYEAWLDEIAARLNRIEVETPEESVRRPSPFGVNLMVHKTNTRLARDLAITVKNRVAVVITSLGAVPDVVDAIHSYRGMVFHDVINLRHAEKAAAAGADGLIAVCAGAGGHAGLMNPFAFVGEIRQFYDKTLILSGSISTGRDIAAAELMGADLAYLGTRFISTHESMAPEGYKAMIVKSTAKDIVYTSAISGVAANFLRGSIAAAGLDPDHLEQRVEMDMSAESEAKAWKDYWSAGQGVGNIHDVLPAAELCSRLIREYHEAIKGIDPAVS